MSHKEVKLELDRSGEPFEAGETMSGTVTIEPISGLKCESLVLELVWVAWAKDEEEDERTVETIELDSDFEVAAGESRTWRFTLQAPMGPVTYQGKKVSIEWALKVKARRPPRFTYSEDPGDIVAFELKGVPGKDYQYDQGGEIPKEEGPLRFQDSGAGCLVFIGLVVGAGIWGTVELVQLMLQPGPTVEETVEGIGFYGLMALCTAALTAFFIVSFFRSYRELTTGSRLERVELKLDPDPVVHRGGKLRCSLRLLCKKPVTIRRVTAGFEVLEGYTHMTYRDAERYYNKYFDVVRKDMVEFEGVEGMSVMDEAVLEQEIDVPNDLPCSFYARDNTVHVRFALELNDTTGKVRWTFRDTLFVVP